MYLVVTVVFVVVVNYTGTNKKEGIYLSRIKK
jgi:hypothetical protein